MKSIGLYIHIPFCLAKCGYCDFNSAPVGQQPTLPIVEALAAELANRRARTAQPISTVFVGGGTPTVLPAVELDMLLRSLRGAGVSDRIAEFTTEANPGTLDNERLDTMTAAGVDRVSLGAQSFIPAELATLGRNHQPDEVTRSVRSCRRHGIRRINLDLIFGVPGQTLASWRESVRRTVELGVEHVACYGLTYASGTPLTSRRDRGEITPCDEELEADMYLAAIDDLAAAGYAQYEISNFALPGQRCLHNLVYWDNQPYIGIGPSAAGYVDGVRYANVADPDEYVRRIARDGVAVADSERLTGTALAGETAMLRLRLNDGLRFDDFFARTGLDARRIFAASIARYTTEGWLEQTDIGLMLTRSGRLMANPVMADFIAEANGEGGVLDSGE